MKNSSKLSEISRNLEKIEDDQPVQQYQGQNHELVRIIQVPTKTNSQILQILFRKRITLIVYHSTERVICHTDSPRLADGSIPILPVIIEASSDRMSPNILFVTIVSNCNVTNRGVFVGSRFLLLVF